MPTLFIQYNTREGSADDVIKAIEEAFKAVNEARPDSIQWTYWYGPRENEFGALLWLADGVENPLVNVKEARLLQAAVAQAVDGDPPSPRPVRMIGSYGRN